MIVRLLNENERSLLKLACMEVTHDTIELTVEEAPKSAPQPGKRAENREAQVQRILEAATKCFVRSGFRGASMHDICREAEMSPGALYRYFPSKEAVIEAISENHRREDMAFLSRMGEGPTIIDGFMAAVMAHLTHVHTSGMGPLFTEIKAESLRNETVRKCCLKSEGQFIAAFRAFARSATDAGLINPISDIETLVPVMMALGEGIIFSDLPEQGITPDKLEPFLRALAVAFLRPADTFKEKVS
jgi:TetR/AcrR family transcriptional regulator, repressor for uid operon